MIDEDRKILTEFLGLCWHEWQGGISPDGCGMTTVTCKKCKVMQGLHFYHTFTTPDDMMAVKRQLVEKGEFDDFYEFAYCRWRDDPTQDGKFVMFDWLIDEARFCQLAADYLRREK